MKFENFCINKINKYVYILNELLLLLIIIDYVKI